jgi:tetratricopeptide (TPR) repeat protein
MARTREEDTPLQYEGKGTFSQRIKDKLFSVDPHLLAFVLARNEFKIVQVLSTHWLEITPLLSEAGLMTLTLRKRLTEINCTSCQKADMILAQAVSSPDGPVKLLQVLYRLSSSDGPTGVLMQAILRSLLSLSDANVASRVDTRIKQVWFPSVNCWPKQIGMVDIFEEFHEQETYCRVWMLARSGKYDRAAAEISAPNLPASMHANDVHICLSEAIITEYRHRAHYQELEGLIQQTSNCRNEEFLLARLHRRMIGYYFFNQQDLGKAYHHLFKAYEICTRLEPDECTVRVIMAWGTYMNLIGDYVEARKAYTLAVEQTTAVPPWMRPLVEGVKLDKAQFHVNRALYFKNIDNREEGDNEVEHALKTIKNIDTSLLPSSHLSLMKYVEAQICYYNGHLSTAVLIANEGLELFGSRRVPLYNKIGAFIATMHDVIGTSPRTVPSD